MSNRLYVLVTGGVTLDRSGVLAEQEAGTKMKVPVLTYLVRTPDANVLIDTGLMPLGATDPEAARGKMGRFMPPDLKPGEDVVGRLAALGLTPDDIHVVVNTHLHWDHCGANRLFPKATFFVQREEYRFALYPSRFHGGGYLPNHHEDPELNYKLLDGDGEVVPGVTAVMTAGHTIGHQSIVVEMDSGPVVLAGDAAYVQRNLDRSHPPGHCWDQAEAIRSIARLRNLGRLLKAPVWPGHDAEWLAKARVAPEFYE